MDLEAFDLDALEDGHDVSALLDVVVEEDDKPDFPDFADEVLDPVNEPPVDEGGHCINFLPDLPDFVEEVEPDLPPFAEQPWAAPSSPPWRFVP